MNLAQRILKAVRPEDPAKEVGVFHSRLVQESRKLVQFAGLSPTPHPEKVLRQLAEEDAALAHRLRERLIELGLSLPAPVSQVPSVHGLNHWARLVQLLEAHRETHHGLIEASVHFADLDEGLAQLLEALSKEEEQHVVRLRDLIARADPQALD